MLTLQLGDKAQVVGPHGAQQRQAPPTGSRAAWRCRRGGKSGRSNRGR
eukprot:gene1187-1651_t